MADVLDITSALGLTDSGDSSLYSEDDDRRKKALDEAIRDRLKAQGGQAKELRFDDALSSAKKQNQALIDQALKDRAAQLGVPLGLAQGLGAVPREIPHSGQDESDAQDAETAKRRQAMIDNANARAAKEKLDAQAANELNPGTVATLKQGGISPEEFLQLRESSKDPDKQAEAYTKMAQHIAPLLDQGSESYNPRLAAQLQAVMDHEFGKYQAQGGPGGASSMTGFAPNNGTAAPLDPTANVPRGGGYVRTEDGRQFVLQPSGNIVRGTYDASAPGGPPPQAPPHRADILAGNITDATQHSSPTDAATAFSFAQSAMARNGGQPPAPLPTPGPTATPTPGPGPSATPTPTPAPRGLLVPGNIGNLFDRKVLNNPDGSYSTTSSMSFQDERGREVLIPTVIDGKRLSAAQAVQHYRATGEHLGIFDNPANADTYATQLHNDQAARGPGGSGGLADQVAAAKKAAADLHAQGVPPQSIFDRLSHVFPALVSALGPAEAQADEGPSAAEIARRKSLMGSFANDQVATADTAGVSRADRIRQLMAELPNTPAGRAQRLALERALDHELYGLR